MNRAAAKKAAFAAQMLAEALAELAGDDVAETPQRRPVRVVEVPEVDQSTKDAGAAALRRRGRRVA